MSFYEEIKKRAEALGGSCVWQEHTVGHGTSERVLVVYPPAPMIVKKSKSNNKLITLDEVVTKLRG